MHIAIVEDTKNDCMELMRITLKYFRDRHLTCDCDCFTSGESFLATFRRGSCDIIFLDIYMPGINGMDTARQIREIDNTCPLIFFSGSYAHAVESYEVRASYYLTKPLRAEMLYRALDHVCEVPQKSLVSLSATCKGGVKTQIPLKDILYVDSIARHTYVHLSERQILVEDSIVSVLDRLSEDDRFLSCNRNIMINMDWIESVSANEFFFKNGDKAPIRQRGRGAVKKTYLEYSLRELRKESTV